MDGVSFSMVTEPFTKFVDNRLVRMDRAAKYTIRATGRAVAKDAKAKAPVLRGRGNTSAAAMRRGVKFRKAGGIGPVPGQQMTVGRSTLGGPVAGLLRASIKPSRRLQIVGAGTYQLKVGPRGQRVHLYAKKQESRVHYMQRGYQMAQAQMPVIAAAVYAKVWKE